MGAGAGWCGAVSGRPRSEETAGRAPSVSGRMEPVPPGSRPLPPAHACGCNLHACPCMAMAHSGGPAQRPAPARHPAKTCVHGGPEPWTLNPGPRQGYDIMEDIYSAKTAAMTFLHELCKARAKGNLDMLMQVGGHGWGGWKLEVSQYVAHGWLGRLVGDGSGGCCGAPCLCRYYVACLTICPSFPPSLLSLSLLRPAVPAAPGGGAE